MTAFAVPQDILQDIWIEHLLFRGKQAEQPAQSEAEWRLILQIAPKDYRPILALTEHYMDHRHWLGTASLARLAEIWFSEDDLFPVYNEETSTWLTVNAQAVEVSPQKISHLLEQLRAIPAKDRSEHLLRYEIQMLRPLLSKFPHSKDLLLIWSQVLKDRQEWTLFCAVNHYAMEVAPDSLPFINNLILGLLELGEVEQASSWCQRWLQRYPRDRNLLAHQALLSLRKQEEAAQQVEKFSAWIEVDRDNPQPLRLRGLAYLALGELEEANRDLVGCLRMQKEFPQLYLDLLRLALAQGEVEQARGWLKSYRERVSASVYRRQLERLVSYPPFKKAGLHEE